jgi:hypothetical protein
MNETRTTRKLIEPVTAIRNNATTPEIASPLRRNSSTAKRRGVSKMGNRSRIYVLK